MRVEEIIGEIAKSAEYLNLTALWRLIKNEPVLTELAMSEIQKQVYILLSDLGDRLIDARKSFLKPIINGWRPKNGKISNGAVDTFYFIAPENVQREWEAFVKETDRQMPAYKAAKDWREKNTEETEEEDPIIEDSIINPVDVFINRTQ